MMGAFLKKRKAVILLSGGMDSAVALWWAKNNGFSCHALSFDYGQRHRKEIVNAKKLARAAKVPLTLVRFKIPWKGSSLINRYKKLPRHSLSQIGKGGIPSTYVPGRNTLFLSFGLSLADQIGADAIVIGANAVDYSGYPDCRPQYLKAFERVSLLGTKQGSEGKKIAILSPLVRLTKGEIVSLGEKLGVPLSRTWSCYKGGRKPCGRCDSCILREKGFKEYGTIQGRKTVKSAKKRKHQ